MTDTRASDERPAMGIMSSGTQTTTAAAWPTLAPGELLQTLDDMRAEMREIGEPPPAAMGIHPLDLAELARDFAAPAGLFSPLQSITLHADDSAPRLPRAPSSAAEFELRIAEAERRLAPLRAELSAAVDNLVFQPHAREVCARRARKLRRRGEDVRFARWTPTGKCRYVWARRIRIVQPPGFHDHLHSPHALGGRTT